MKTSERAEARRFRSEQGRSIKDIARRLRVSQSSVSVWVRDIELTADQRKALERRGMHPGQIRARRLRSEGARYRRILAQVDGRLYARAGDPLHAAGCMLYWAEGAKTRNRAKISNSDPEVLRVFLRFLRAYFVVPNDAIRVTCHLFADHLERQWEIEQFWLDVLELPRSSLCKSIVNVYSKYSKKKRVNRLPYGTCSLTVCRTAIVQHIFGAIQEYGGFERLAWLDDLRSSVPLVRP